MKRDKTARHCLFHYSLTQNPGLRKLSDLIGKYNLHPCEDVDKERRRKPRTPLRSGTRVPRSPLLTLHILRKWWLFETQPESRWEVGVPKRSSLRLILISTGVYLHHWFNGPIKPAVGVHLPFLGG